MIKAVDEIPMSKAKERKSYRDKIRKDLQEAIDKGIMRFEFVGDYNYKYLAQYAREEGDKIIRNAFYSVMAKHRSEFGENYCGWYKVKPNISKYFSVTTVKGETKDNPRVFCEIMDGDLEEIIYNAILQTIEEWKGGKA